MGESSRHLNFQGCTQLKVSSTQYYAPVPSEPAAGLRAEQNVQKNVLEAHSADTQETGDKGRHWMLVFTNVPCAVAKILLLEINIWKIKIQPSFKISFTFSTLNLTCIFFILCRVHVNIIYSLKASIYNFLLFLFSPILDSSQAQGWAEKYWAGWQTLDRAQQNQHTAGELGKLAHGSCLHPPPRFSFTFYFICCLPCLWLVMTGFVNEKKTIWYKEEGGAILYEMSLLASYIINNHSFTLQNLKYLYVWCDIVQKHTIWTICSPNFMYPFYAQEIQMRWVEIAWNQILWNLWENYHGFWSAI